MKPLNFLLLALCLILCSCNNNDEPDLEVTLPVSATYIPVSIEFDINDLEEEQKRNLIHLVNNEHIINNVAELPNDPMGFSEAYHKINFKENTLLVKYVLHDYTVDTYSYRYYRNTQENSYNWVVNIGTASDTDNETQDLCFTRFAILVQKVPADASVTSWFSLTSIGWFPQD